MRTWMTAGWLIVLLAACGSDDGGDAGTVSDSAGDSSPEVLIQITGAYEGTFESRGSIFCSGDEFGGPEEGFELYAMKMPEQFNLRMPRKTAPGIYVVAEGEESPFDFYYSDPKRMKYDRIQSATVQWEAVPQAQRERLVGSIEARLQSRDGQSVEITVSLDLDAGAQSFDECE